MIVKIKSDVNYLIIGIILEVISGEEAQIETVGAYYHKFPP